MNDLSHTLHDLPWMGMIPLCLIMIIGLVLWSAGRKLLRAGFALTGLLIGGSIGFLAGQSINAGISPWIVGLIGAVLLAVFLALAYRVAVAVAMSMLLALASPLMVIAMAEVQAQSRGMTLEQGEVSNPIADPISEWFTDPQGKAEDQVRSAATQSASESFNQSLDRAKSALTDDGRENVETVERYAQRLIDSGKAKWQSTPQKMRPTLILAAVAGALVGLLLGIIGPSFSAAALTSFGGSLLWLSALHVFAIRLGAPDSGWLPRSTFAWMMVWLTATFLGVVIQWTFQRKRADKPDRQKPKTAES